MNDPKASRGEVGSLSSAVGLLNANILLRSIW